MSSTGAIPKRAARATDSQGKDDPDVIGEPLDKKFITVPNQSGERQVPALHQCWTQKGTYIRYVQPPPKLLADGSPSPPGASESWVEQMELLEEDLKALLHLPHHKFWSQIVYDPAVHMCLESYLSRCPRWYEENLVDEFCQDLIDSLHRLVLLIYLRLATPRESQSCHITPSVFGRIIYDNFLLDVCQLLDLSVVYGPSCIPLLTRMFACVFRYQSDYYKDLSLTVSSVTVALESVEDKLGVADHKIPIPLHATPDVMSFPDLQTVVLFLLDTFSSLNMFLFLHPPAAKCFINEVNELRLSSFYERVVPALMKQLSEMSQGSDWNPRIVKEMNYMRSSVLATFRALLYYKCLAPLQEDKTGTAMVGECVEKFLQIMSTCVGERIFITDYCSAYPITQDLQMFTDQGGDITSLSFVKEAIASVLSETRGCPTEDVGPLMHQTPETQQESVDTSGMNGYAQEGSEEPMPDLDLAAGVSSVQELLPDLGAGFIKECLRYYSHCPEEVINAVLENNLPPSLSTLDRSAPLPPSTPPPIDSYPQDEQMTSGILDERANVYDNDEFDMFKRKDVNLSKMHKGKRKTTTKALLYERDESTTTKLKEIGRKYEELGGTSIYEDELRYEVDDGSKENYHPWDYEDEYDDTYDDNETGDIDELDAEKVVKRRPGIIGAGRLNTCIDYGDANNSSDEKSDLEDEGSQDTSETQDSSQQKGIRLQTGVKPKVIKTNTRGVQRIFNKSSSKPSRPKQSTPEREVETEETSSNPVTPRPSLQPFCENPEFVRQRAEQRRRDREYNRGYRGRGGEQQHGRESRVANSIDDVGTPARPKISQTSQKSSGKGWRHGEGGDEDRGGYRGGKYKEDINHGKAQSQQHRHKMIHKNEHKRKGAQAKFNRNN